MNPMRKCHTNGSKFFLFEINQKQIFLFDFTLSSSLVCQNQKRLVTNRRLREMLRIWLPLQEVGELSQTEEFRNIDKCKTNVQTELMIEGGGGGYKNVHLH